MNMKITAIRQRKHDTQRAAEIVGAFAKYGLADWFKDWHLAWIQERIKSFDGRPIPELAPAERLRLVFTELGPTSIKLGQLLGTRPELVGTEIAAETRAPTNQSRSSSNSATPCCANWTSIRSAATWRNSPRTLPTTRQCTFPPPARIFPLAVCSRWNGSRGFLAPTPPPLLSLARTSTRSPAAAPDACC